MSVALVVDDSPRIIAGLGRTLRRFGLSVIAFSSTTNALDAIDELSSAPALALIDLYLDGGHLGLEVIEALEGRFPGCVTMRLMSGYETNHSLSDRASELFSKPIEHDSLRAFARRAMAVSTLASASRMRDVVISVVEAHDLSPQEARIVGLCAAGTGRRELAAALNLSENTLKSQIRSMLAKFDIDTLDELALLLLRGLDLATRPPSQHAELAGKIQVEIEG